MGRARGYGGIVSQAAVGALLRDWRTRRRVSQLDLSLSVGVSARHLSFIETGRSRPSPEMVIALAEGLDIPLRERNTLLLAAGFAPRYMARRLEDSALSPARAAITRLLDAHDPYPGVVIDRCWNIVGANAAATTLTAGLPDELLGPPANVYRLCLHPDGLAGRTLNFAEWGGYLLHQLQRTVTLTGDPAVRALQREVLAYPGVAGVAARERCIGPCRPARPVRARCRRWPAAVDVHDADDLRNAPRRDAVRTRRRAVLSRR